MPLAARCALAAALAVVATACATGPAQAPAAQAPATASQWLVITVRNGAEPQSQRAGSIARGYDTASTYGVTAAAAAASHSLARDFGLQQVSAWPMTHLPVHCVLFHTSAALNAATLERLAHDPRVESLQPLNEFQALAAAPQPPADDGQWMPYNDPYGRLQHALRDLDVIAAQRRTRGAGVRIAVIDTGVDIHHPDLKGRILAHRNFVDADEAAFQADRHGTEVAGVIAAVADNGVGIVGIAPESRLLVLKACWQRGAGAPSVCNSYTLAQALDAAISAHADIVNLSLSGPPDPLLTRLIQVGLRRGMIYVAAVPPGSAEGFPASLAGVLAVATAEDNGPTRSVAAPGRDILTLTPGGHYDFASGSSLAAAEVTGIAALLLAAHHHLSGLQLREALQISAGGAPGAARAPVNARAALEWLLSGQGEMRAGK